MKTKLSTYFTLLLLVVFASSCTKEDLKPSRVESLIFVESEMLGKDLNFYSGQDNFITMPKVDKVNILGNTISLYTSNFTNGRDSFRVGFMAVKPFWISAVSQEEELNRTLDYAKHNPESLFTDFGGVGINWRNGDKSYTTPADAELQKGSYFRISKVEDYTPPGADHAMKKIDVTFRCQMQNYNDPNDTFWLENGKATLLLDYMY